MATQALEWDFSGLYGYAYNDRDGSLAQQQLVYRDGENKYADGVYNPVMHFGYLSPSNSETTAITGLDNKVVAAVYDHTNDYTYLQQVDGEIFKLTTSTDVTAASLLTITSGEEFRDMVMYEVGGKKALVYLIDSLDTAAEGFGVIESGGMYVGYYTLDQDDGAEILDKTVNSFTSGVNLYDHYVVPSADQNAGTGRFRKICFEITSADTSSFSSTSGQYLSGVSLWMGRNGTAAATIRVSLQGDASASVSPYTARGAWVTATAYAVNNTVTNSGTTYQCHTAHTSGASSQPGVGGAWEDYWNVFGSPDGTVLASDTINFNDVPDYISQAGTRVRFSWAPYNLTASRYWIVIEETTSAMGSGDELQILGTINGTGIYDGNAVRGLIDSTPDYWRDTNFNGDYGLDNISFILHLNRRDNWSQNMAYGRFNQDTGQNGFLFPSENGLLYWVCGNNVHALDGSVTGGGFGRANENVLSFASYVEPVDIEESRGNMYIAIQPTQPETLVSTSGDGRVGVFIWDKRSQIQGESDFFPCPGASRIHMLFRSATGNIMAITSNAGGNVEIRGIQGNHYAVLERLQYNAYPTTRRSKTYVNNMVYWMGKSGLLYAFGQPAPGYDEKTFRVHTVYSGGSTFYPGIIINSSITSVPLVRYTYSLSTESGINAKFWSIQNMGGTAEQGDVLTTVRYLPPLSTVRNLTMYCAPTDPGSDTTATIKFYFNQSSTVGMTKTITKDMTSRGYVSFDLNKHNVNAIQIEIEWEPTLLSPEETFHPSVGVLTYDTTTTHTTSKD